MSSTYLVQAPVPWECNGKTYLIGHSTLELELHFQSAHEAWARNRLEATRARVSKQAYSEDLDTLNEQRSANRFAFGSHLSLSFLASPAGLLEYTLLKMQKGEREGGAKITRTELATIQRDDPAAWGEMTVALLERDFPNVWGPAPSPSGETETPVPGTSE